MKPTDIHSGVTRELLDHLFDIRPDEGLIYWRRAPRKPWLNGKLAGHAGHRFGYVMICIKGKDFKRHRLIWFYVHGRWPEDELDHIDGDRTADRIANLREANKCQNMWNAVMPMTNTSGCKGVSWDQSKKRWRVTIRANGNWHQVGRFASLVNAIAARAEAERIYHGSYARTAT